MSAEVKYLSYEGLSYLVDELKTRFVQQEANKGLSENDFTNLMRTKLEGIDSGAEKNVVHSVNNKTGDIMITADDIDFLSSTSGATVTTIRAAIDGIAKEINTHRKDIDNKAEKSDVYTKVDVDSKLSDLDTGVTSVNSKTGNVSLTTDDISDTDSENKFVTDSEKSSWGSKADVGYVDSAVDRKVDKIAGKELTTNDFTNALLKKLDGMEEGAQKNRIELIKRNGTNLTITGKAVDIEVPTKVSDVANDRQYQTKTEVQKLVTEHGKLKKEIVSVLPAIEDADDNTMYLVRNKEDSGYEEWMIINGKWEILGDTAAVDFTGYIHEDDIKIITDGEIDALLKV